MKMSKNNITAVILAGGKGRRLGGQDKGLVIYKDRPLIEHVLERIKPQVNSILINANRNKDIYASYAYPVINDEMQDYQGPLAGFSTAMNVVTTDYIITLPCDGPLFPHDLVSRMLTALDNHPERIVVARDGKRLQPVYALIPLALQSSLNTFLASNDRKIDHWYAKHDFITVDFSDVPNAFANINTEEQRQELEKAMSDKKQTSCADPSEPDAISVMTAKKRILDEIKPITAREKIALRSCLNRFLAEDIHSSVDVPPHINSAMDGYAIAGEDLPRNEPQNYPVIGTSYAGKASTESHQQGQVFRIMTGGVMPQGTDTVVMQEQVEVIDDNTIRLKPEHKSGQNVRQKGEDIRIGQKLLSKGKQITPADLGILASLGISELDVYRRPRIAFFSTGDELRSIGEALGEGEIYDSNRYTLFGMLKQLDTDIIDMGVIPDQKDSIRQAFISASNMADVVITSGGVSVGEADYIKPTLKELGNAHFWKIAMKPGRPLTFGELAKQYGSAWFFGLPGNPVAVMVTFMQFVQPALHYLASGIQKQTVTLSATCTSKLYKRAGRTEFQRGIFEQSTDGKLSVKRTGKQGSGILTSMSLANCFILLPEESTGAEEGDQVEIQPFSGTI